MGIVKRLNNGHVLGVMALIALPLQILSWPSLQPVMVIAALAVVGLRRISWPRLPPWLLALSLSLVILSSASALWSLNPLATLKTASWLLGALATGLVLLAAARELSLEERRICQNGLVLGFLAGLALLEIMLLSQGRALEYVRHLSLLAPLIGGQRPVIFPTQFDTSMSFVTLLVWPVSAILAGRRRALLAAGVAALALTVVAQGGSAASKEAFVLAGLLFLVARWIPRGATYFFGIALAAGIILAPLLLRSDALFRMAGAIPVPPGKQASLAHRFAIWQFAIGKIDERPILGWGLDSSRWMPGGHRPYESGSELLPLHPHDAALQLRLDLGIPGVLLGACFVLSLASAIGAAGAGRDATALALGQMAAASVLALVSYDLWHVWWLMMLWCSAVSMVVALDAARQTHRVAGRRHMVATRNAEPE